MATILRPRPVREQVSAEEWALRQELACAFRFAHAQGWDDLVFTHFSARVEDEPLSFLINPFDLLFEEITASSLSKLDRDGKALIDNGFATNQAGYVIHSAIQMARPDARVVMHLHTVAGTAVAAMAEGLLPISQAAAQILPEIAYHDYEGIAVDTAERERLVRDLGDKSLMILRNHGTLAVGRTVGQAMTRLYFLERACAMQVAALSGGRPLVETPPESIAQAHGFGEKTLGFIGDGLVWPAIRRRMERLDTSFLD
jgi:ribulose-5-phosphate 4-epimerase/fuculose-1-phosphate aldolase